jgi:hypothetical protein
MSLFTKRTLFILAIGLLLGTTNIKAQNISVADFYYAENDLTARTHGTSVEDQNGNLCALIKVRTTERGLWTFDVGMLGVTRTEMQNESHAAEIWVYVPFGVTRITIQHERLGLLDKWKFLCDIAKGCTYVMVLDMDASIPPPQGPQQQYLVFQISPADATLEVNDSAWRVENDGNALKSVGFGTYKYRVQSHGYKNEVGMVTVDNLDKPKIVSVVLTPVFSETQSSNQQITPIPSEGFLEGVFSVSPTQKVRFSKGNLQYQASTDIWRFAEHQWDMIGKENKKISNTNNNWIDLFGWGTGDDPIKHDIDNKTYKFVDWGNNPISNGGNVANLWRTLKKDEWVYIIQKRKTASGIRYAKAQVNGVNGLILLPDSWDGNTYALKETNTNDSKYSSNIIGQNDWNNMELAGAVFLPSTGYRAQPPVAIFKIGSRGNYWSSTDYNFQDAYYVWIDEKDVDPASSLRFNSGYCVRLVYTLQ